MDFTDDNSPDDIDVNKLNSCLAPVVKTFKASERMVKLLWGLFCAIMIILLTCFIILVLNKYLSHVTITRIEYLRSPESINLPAFTTCFRRHRLGNLAKSPRYNKEMISKLKNILPPTNFMCSKLANWNSSTDGKSGIYDIGGHYTVQVATSPSVSMKLTVMEQVYGMPDKICNTFKLSSCEKNSTNFWKILNIKTFSEEDYEMTLHQKEDYPFDNIGHNIYGIYSKFVYYIFFSLRIQNRLDTPRSPCLRKDIELFDKKYSYNQAICNANITCSKSSNLHEICPLDMIDRLKNSPNSKFEVISRNYEECIAPCVTSTFTVNNILKLAFSGSVISLVRSEGIQERTEEQIVTLAKLFSEIGGLGSFFIGFSLIVLFEIFELAYHFRKRVIRRKQKIISNNSNFEKNRLRTEYSILRCANHEKNSSPILSKKNQIYLDSRKVVFQDHHPNENNFTVRVEFDGEIFQIPCEIIIE